MQKVPQKLHAVRANPNITFLDQFVKLVLKAVLPAQMIVHAMPVAMVLLYRVNYAYHALNFREIIVLDAIRLVKIKIALTVIRDIMSFRENAKLATMGAEAAREIAAA
jgi:hypothetical protein